MDSGNLPTNIYDHPLHTLSLDLEEPKRENLFKDNIPKLQCKNLELYLSVGYSSRESRKSIYRGLNQRTSPMNIFVKYNNGCYVDIFIELFLHLSQEVLSHVTARVDLFPNEFKWFVYILSSQTKKMKKIYFYENNISLDQLDLMKDLANGSLLYTTYLNKIYLNYSFNGPLPELESYERLFF